MKKKLFKLLSLSIILTLSFLMLTNTVFANWYETGTFPRNNKHIGQFGTYENKDVPLVHTRLYVTSHSQTTATTSVKAGIHEGHVTASAGASKNKLVEIRYNPPIFYYAGGITD